MDVALDTNILIKDLWLRSQAMRLLFDYIDRTDSRFLLSEVVIQEAEAYFKRQISHDLSAIQQAIHDAKRHSLIGITELDYQQIREATYTKWRKNLDSMLEKGTGVLYRANSTPLAEAVKRSIERIPPCKESGEGMRDAVIWLSFPDYCTERLKTYHGYHVAFISENVRDFANNDRDEFHPRLQEDVNATSVVVDYYPSLDSFIEKQAKPISHISVEWVAQRINLDHIRSMIEGRLIQHRYSWQRTTEFFLISDDRLRQLYIPSGTPQIYQLDTNLEGVKVFQFDDAHIEASLEFYAYAEADVDCQLVESVTRYSFTESVVEENDLRSKQNLVCIADLRVFVSAVIKGDTIEILELEDISDS